jgi:hypothetical protein
MLHVCLVNSLTGQLASFIAQKQNGGETLNDGAILLKIIQDKVRGKAVRQNMSNARTELKAAKLKEFKWNITNFNEHLKGLITTLRNNEEPFLDTDVSDTLVTNYKEVRYDEFNMMLNILLNEAHKQNRNPDWEELMEQGEATYEMLVSKGVWGKKTAQEEKLFALQAQVKALEALQASKEKSNKGTKKNAKKGKGKNKRTYPEWHFKNEANKQTLKKTIQVDGVAKEVTYYWCPNHAGNKGMWVRHKPSECKNKDRARAASNAGQSNSDQPSLVANRTVLDEE